MTAPEARRAGAARLPDVSYDADVRATIEAVFEEALDLPTDSRAAWLADRCAGDVALRREVDALLAAHESDGAFDRLAQQPVAAALETALGDAPDPAGPGRHVGPYRVVRELGRGGMGVVYLAERVDGQFRQRVAVKLLRASPDADDLERRFLAERQILASLSHPNVAQLLDGGVTDGGLPYLVIEYIDGLQITEYCDRERLGVEARLALFVDVCAAVHHAHQNLVLHRDLKPGNVLVTTEGHVKLLDFGIAKLLDPGLGPTDAPETRTAARLMTPAYASPEQLRGDPLTTASDVYALGLVLYELLTGSQAHRVMADAPRGIYEAVVEREPERPSTRVTHDTASASAAAVAAARGTTPERLRRRLRGDLDAIVAKALRKEAGRRYGSAELLAADVTRYLEGLPVLARRGSRWYRMQKLVRRHRVAVAFAALSLLLLAGGAGVALHLAATASNARDRAAFSLAESQHALRESDEVQAFLVDLFDASDPSLGRADSLTARDLLRRGIGRAERLSREPLVQARMLEALGRVHAKLSDLPLAERLLRRALALRRTYLAPDHVQTAAIEAELSDVLRWRGAYAAADTMAREALRVRRQALGESHPDVAASMRQVGALAIYLGDLRSAEAFDRQAIAADRRGGRGVDSSLVRDLLQLAGVLWRRGDAAGAELAFREARTTARHAFPNPHPERVIASLRLADALDERLAAQPEAESLYREALAETRAVYGDAHAATAGATEQLGEMLVRHGRVAEATQLLREALDLQRRAYGPSNPEIAVTEGSLAEALSRDGYSPEAERLTRDALAVYAAALGTRHNAYAGGLGFLADMIAKRGALDSAEMLYRRAVVIRRAGGTQRRVIVALTNGGLAGVLTLRRRFVEADSLYRSVLAVLLSNTTPAHVDVRRTYAGMARLYDAWGKPDSAARYRRLAQPPGYAAP